MLKLIPQQITLDAAGPDGLARRTITGLAAPYGVMATVSDGTRVILEPGSLPVEGRAPTLQMYHDSTQVIGRVVERVDAPEGMYFTAKISATNLGNEALVLASDGVLDSVSVGISPTEFSYDSDGIMHVTAATFDELSLVAQGAWASAQITQVAASIPQTEPDNDNNNDQTPTEEIPLSDSITPVEAPEVIVANSPIFAQAKRTFAMPSAGEYLAAMHIGGETFRNVQAAAQDFVKSKQTALQAAAGDVLTTDTPGLLPVPVLGPIFENLNFIRPVVAAVGTRAMPDGGNTKTFIRPTWTTHTSVSVQSSELSPVSATTPVIAANVVGKQTVSGGVNFSVQDIDFTSPAALQMILQDLAGEYLLKTDDIAADAIVAGASASGSTWTVTANDPSSLIAAFYDAATDILSASNFLPDHLFVSPDVWQKLGSQLDANKNPIFPYTGAAGLMGVNAMGTANITQLNTFNPFGLNLVVDKNFASGTMVAAKGSAIEFYEQVRGIMSVEVPATLGRTFSYYGYVSTFIASSALVKSIVIA